MAAELTTSGVSNSDIRTRPAAPKSGFGTAVVAKSAVARPDRGQGSGLATAPSGGCAAPGGCAPSGGCRGELTGEIEWGDASMGDPALEPAGRILSRVHTQYLLDQLVWTLQAGRQGSSAVRSVADAEQRAADLEYGIAALRTAVHDLDNGCLAR
jgi:hypothetical protein